MKSKFNRQKYLLLLITSWLVTRLKLTFEISRLAFFRINSQPEIRFVIKKKKVLPLSAWKFENKRLTFIDYNFESGFFELHKLPELQKN